jgi:hypothetical protein
MERQRKRDRGQNKNGEIEERHRVETDGESRAETKGRDGMIDGGKDTEERDRRPKTQRGKEKWRETLEKHRGEI